MSMLAGAAGGGGYSASSAANQGDTKGGSTGNVTQTFGGINTGKQNDLTPLLIAAAVAVVLLLVFRK